MANGIAIKDVDNKLQSLEGEEVIPISTGANEPEVVEVDTLKEYINDDIDTALEGKQDVINDLDTIRSGAAAGATAYQKPGTGIPSTDLSSDVQTSLGKANTALQSFTEEDPTVPSWAKASSKPSYTASEVGAVPTTRTVNGKALSENISLTASDVGALPSNTELFSGSYTDLTNKPTLCVGSSSGAVSSSTVIGIPAGGNAGQVLYKVDGSTDYSVGWTNQTMNYPSAYCTTSGSTAAKKASCTLYAAQANSYLHVLIGSTNTYAGALTLNVNLEGAKPIYINGAASSATNYTLPKGTYIVFYDGTNYYFRTDGKIEGLQETLVSGTNIKTINNTSLLGSGNISISGGSGDVNVIESITFNGDAVAIDSSKNAAITYTAPVTSVNGNTGDVTISTGDANVIEGIKLDGESSSLTPSSKVVTIPSMGASGSNHRGGLVPDPGSTQGTTKFLREDGSWQVPPSGGGGEVNTIESISVNTVAQIPDANKNVDITVPDVSGKEDSSNKVTSLSASSTDTQYPSAKCVWDLVGDIETLLAAI